MDGGLIVQMGTHPQLLADGDGLYRRLCARQFGETDFLPPIPTIRSDPAAAGIAGGTRRRMESAPR
jgi:hypothetical protein